MDFKPGIIQSFPGNIPLPFYMTYPGYLRAEQESEILKDLEYLQQTCPGEIRRYQIRIAEMLDKLDYEGSMIYDEYPDRYSIMRLAESMVQVLRQEEEEARPAAETALIQILLCNEIYKRRHGGRRGVLRFR